jgi:hypothetical protein
MGIAHADLFRNLAAAIDQRPHRVDGGVIHVDDGPHRIVIRYSAEGERRIGALRLPFTVLEFRFEGHDEAVVNAFMECFRRAYQRGGG